MPLYEYSCRACGHQFEQLVTNSTRLACPSCHGDDLEKLLSVFAVGAAQPKSASSVPSASACGTCGDPRGPGSCRLQ